MSIRIDSAGLQTTIQAGARIGHRHVGVPLSGAADSLSLALANRVLDNDRFAPSLEATLGGVEFLCESAVSIAVSGAPARCCINGAEFPMHVSTSVAVGDVVSIGAPVLGARTYVGFRGGLCADRFLGSQSTYLPAELGGHSGLALQRGDRINLNMPECVDSKATPAEFQMPMRAAWTLRCGRSAEADLLSHDERLYGGSFTVSHRSDRMGIQLDGTRLETKSDGKMQSVAVFPGMVQCPEDGRPFILGVDAQTTGGYPRVAKVARLDLHSLGQLRPGDSVRFLYRDDALAASELQQKHDYWRPWLADIEGII